MRAGPPRLGPPRIRPAYRGPARPAPHILCGPHTLARPTYTLARGPARFFFFFKFFNLFIFFMIKPSMFKNWETLRSSQN